MDNGKRDPKNRQVKKILDEDIECPQLEKLEEHIQFLEDSLEKKGLEIQNFNANLIECQNRLKDIEKKIDPFFSILEKTHVISLFKKFLNFKKD